MVLTLASRTPREENSFPTLQLFVLAICRVAEPIALASCFPYAWVMVKDFHIGAESSASTYCGVFISAFSFAESLTGMFWGCLSDRIGRKPVLLIGCGGTMISLLLVGFATNFWFALAARMLGGLLNGNMGVIQTMVGELVHKPEHEPRAYAVMPFVWSVGTIIGPAIGGMLAKPSVSLPWLFPPSGLFTTFPYLLPNLVCAVLLLVSVVSGCFLLVETHPDMQPWSTEQDLDNSKAETPPMVTSRVVSSPVGGVRRANNYGTFSKVPIQGNKRWRVKEDGSSVPPFQPPLFTHPKVFTKRVMMIVMALGIFTYHSMTYDHLFPIFLQDSRDGRVSTSRIRFFDIPGGLGLTTQSVGIIMSVNGLIALFIQAIVFPFFATWLGIWQLFIVVTTLHPLEYVMVPYLKFLPEKFLYSGIWVALSVRNFTSILAYPLLLIMLKEASPSSSNLGEINGGAASAAAACRTAAPPLSGYLYSIGARQGFTGLAWWASGVIAAFGAIQAFWVVRERKKLTTVTLAAPCITSSNP